MHPLQARILAGTMLVNIVCKDSALAKRKEKIVVELGKDGLPADRRLRSLAVRLKYAASRNPNGEISKNFLNFYLEKHVRPKDHSVMVAIWKALIKAKVLVRVEAGGRFVFRNEKRKDPSTRENRIENYEAVIRDVGERLCLTPRGKKKASALFRELRLLQGPVVADAGGCPALVVASSIGINGNGPFIREGRAVIITPRGALPMHVEEGAVTHKVRKGLVHARLDRRKCFATAELQASFQESPVNPWVRQDSSFYFGIMKLSSKSLRAVQPDRVKFENLVGEKITPRKWQSFMASLRRTKPVANLFVSKLYGLLDKEVRKAAMRDPQCKYAAYNWLCGPDEETGRRRVQATSVIPLLSYDLRRFEEVVDGGWPLLEAWSSEYGIAIPALKRMRGLSWQRTGRHYHLVRRALSDRHLGFLLSSIPPERVPASRNEWDAAVALAEGFGEALGWPLPGNVARALSANWEAAVSLVRGDFVHALVSTAKDITPALAGHWSGDFGHRLPGLDRENVKAARLVMHLVVGETGGLKRMREFNSLWHRAAGRRVVELRKIQRDLFGGQAKSWPPLLPEDYSCEAGTMKWLTDEDMLVAEGIEMHHCVASYDDYCVAGRSHIAAVRGNDGSRSTVEFVIDGKKIHVVQHRAKWNTAPQGGVVAVLERFLQWAQGKEFVRRGLEAGSPSEGVIEFGADAAIGDDVARQILDVYADCFPKAADLNVHELRSVFQAMDGFHIPLLAGGHEIDVAGAWPH